jgi:hypothetical protein
MFYTLWLAIGKQGRSGHKLWKRNGASGNWPDVGHCANLRVWSSGRGAMLLELLHDRTRRGCIRLMLTYRDIIIAYVRGGTLCWPDTSQRQVAFDLTCPITVHARKNLTGLDLTLAAPWVRSSKEHVRSSALHRWAKAPLIAFESGDVARYVWSTVATRRAWPDAEVCPVTLWAGQRLLFRGGL